jgi:DNA-binding NarL/FixJ family response regulator
MAEPAGVEKGIGVRMLALCGESVLIEGIEASLKDHEGVEIVRLDTSQPGAVQALDGLSPNIIIFDLTPIQLSCVFTFLRTHPDVVLIGLDIDFDQVLFLSAEWRRLPTVADLMQVIEARLQVRNGRRL